MRIKTLLITAATCLMLSGCINPPKPLNLPNGYVLPPMPDSTENCKTIGGIDSNNNGVRDDIEIWIYSDYEREDEREVLMQLSRYYQTNLLTVWTKKDTHTVGIILERALKCEVKHFGWHTNLYKKVSSKTHNTLLRVNRYKETNRLAGGEVFDSVPNDVEPCDKIMPVRGIIIEPKSLILPSGYALPPIPDSTENSKTIGGIDSNNNGVRDDIEIWIYKDYEREDERKVLMQHARYIQWRLLNVNSKKDVHIAWEKMSRAVDCEREHFNSPHSILYEKVESKMYNTLMRVTKHKEADRLAGGEVYPLLDFKGKSCEK